MSTGRPKARLSDLFQSHQHPTGIGKNSFRKIHLSFWLGISSISFSVFVYFVFIPLLWPLSIVSLLLSIVGLASANSCIRNHLQTPAPSTEDIYANARIGRLTNMIAIFIPILLIIGMMVFLIRVFTSSVE